MSEDRLHNIELQINEAAFKKMRSAVSSAVLCESGGVEIEIIQKICQAIENGEKGLTLRARK
jgi:hypothetical protein